MEELIIRAATIADIPGICHVNRGEEGPWAEMESCAAWVVNRIRLGFYVQVAELDGRIIAHGEWSLSDERRWKTFYLGQLQVDPDFQFRGAGRRMLADGIRVARAAGCDSISLIPEQDTGSQKFYEKCGLARGNDILRCRLGAEAGPVQGERVSEAPQSVIKRLPFMFGLSQTSAYHMWQVLNRRPEGEGRRVDTLLGDGFCLQIAGFTRSRSAQLLVWAERDSAAEMIRNARAFAWELGYPGVDFYFFPEYRTLFPAGLTSTWDYEMYMRL